MNKNWTLSSKWTQASVLLLPPTIEWLHANKALYNVMKNIPQILLEASGPSWPLPSSLKLPQSETDCLRQQKDLWLRCVTVIKIVLGPSVTLRWEDMNPTVTIFFLKTRIQLFFKSVWRCTLDAVSVPADLSQRLYIKDGWKTCILTFSLVIFCS